MVRRLKFTDPRLHRLGAAFEARGKRTRVVGGAVRNMLAGLPPKDLDLASDALPEEAIEIAETAGFRVAPTGLKHGTVTIVVDGEPFEVTTLRQDVETDGRHAIVEFVPSFRADAARRDFTINAMSASFDGEVYDYFGGVLDLEARRVRFVGRPEARIREDYLRILRFFRFMTGFGNGRADAAAMEAIARLHTGLNETSGGRRLVSGQRIWSELSRILASEGGAREFLRMLDVGILGTLGIDVTKDDIFRAESVRARGGDASMVLGALLADESLILDFADPERWHLSNRDSSRAIAAARVAADCNSSGHYWRCAVADGMDPDIVVAVLAGTGRDQAAAGVLSGVPPFPLAGRDLIAAGIPKGPEVGARLAELRQAWKDSFFVLTADEMLASVVRVDVSAPGP